MIFAARIALPMPDTALVLCSLPIWTLLIAYTLVTRYRQYRQRRALRENRRKIEEAWREWTRRDREVEDERE